MKKLTDKAMTRIAGFMKKSQADPLFDKDQMDEMLEEVPEEGGFEALRQKMREKQQGAPMEPEAGCGPEKKAQAGDMLTEGLNLMLANEYEDYQYVMGMAKDAKDAGELAEWIQDWIENEAAELNLPPKYSDLMSHAVVMVDYQSIAQDFWDQANE